MKDELYAYIQSEIEELFDSIDNSQAGYLNTPYIYEKIRTLLRRITPSEMSEEYRKRYLKWAERIYWAHCYPNNRYDLEFDQIKFEVKVSISAQFKKEERD